MTIIPTRLEDQIIDLYWKHEDAGRRARTKKRTGKVVETDYEKGLYRIQLTEGGQYEPLKTGWIPAREYAMGANRSHMPYTVGEQVVIESENGDLTDAEVTTSLPSNDFERPSQSGSEYIMSQVGGTQFRSRADQALVKSDLVELGDEGGRKVARVTDLVLVPVGSSAGLWQIVTGSERVRAVD